MRPARMRVDLGALRHNYRLAKRLAPQARALAVVKADAYGHGAIAIARALQDLADGFAVACLEEALDLRDSGIRQPILLLEGPFSPDELIPIDQARLAMVAHRSEQIDWILTARPNRPFDCWIKLDSGMHRLGFAPAAFLEAVSRLRACRQIGALTAMSHFARADQPDHPFTAQQLAAFDAAVAGLDLPASLANSAAILDRPSAHRDWVRPGIMLYGVSPFEDDHPQARALRPVMTLESELIAIRTLAAGDSVGYGGRFVCSGPTRIGTVAIGYGDGYPRHAPDGTPVAVAGTSVGLAGRVSMDMLSIDLTGIDAARVGDRVELWGGQINASVIAQASATIAYELFTGVRRVSIEYGD